jgi:hypothetical protein
MVCPFKEGARAMGWYTYFRLLEEYHGDLSKATEDEMKDAYLSNPNTPPRALEIAREKYNQEQAKKKGSSCEVCDLHCPGPDPLLRCQLKYGRRCSVCDKPLQPAPAKFDGEPAIVGYLPCPEHPHVNF